MQYYIYINREPQGPYTIEQLKEVGISKESIVWHEGLDSPTKALKLKALEQLFTITPPPLIPQTTPLLKEISSDNENIPVVNKSEIAEENSGSKKGKTVSRGNIFKKVLAVMFVAVLLFWGFAIYVDSSRYTGNRAFEGAVNTAIYNREIDKEKEKYRNNIGDYLNPHPNSYSKDLVFGGIWDLQIKMDNKTPYVLDQVAVEVSYYKTNGERHKVETIYFRNIAPGERQRLSAPNSSKGVRVKCSVKDVSSSALW